MFRFEAEYTFMNNDVEVAGAAGLSSPAAGNVNLRAWMLNVYHDFQICDWGWKPYVGAGIGMYQSEINSLYPAFFDVVGPPMAGVGVNTTSDMTFAFQFRAGASYQICERMEFYTGYRFFHGDELTFSAPPFSVFAPTFHPDGAEMHCLELGVRVGF
jgi:opacity protein-like surface antigen